MRSGWNSSTLPRTSPVYQCDFDQDDDGPLLLYDDDGNGTIDSSTQVPKAQWSTVAALQWAERYNH